MTASDRGSGLRRGFMLIGIGRGGMGQISHPPSFFTGMRVDAKSLEQLFVARLVALE